MTAHEAKTAIHARGFRIVFAWLESRDTKGEHRGRLLLSGPFEKLRTRPATNGDAMEAEALLERFRASLPDIADCDVPMGWSIRRWREELERRLAIIPEGNPTRRDFAEWIEFLGPVA